MYVICEEGGGRRGSIYVICEGGAVPAPPPLPVRLLLPPVACRPLLPRPVELLPLPRHLPLGALSPMVTVLTISVTLAAFFTNSLVTGGWCARRCVAGRA